MPYNLFLCRSCAGPGLAFFPTRRSSDLCGPAQEQQRSGGTTAASEERGPREVLPCSTGDDPQPHLAKLSRSEEHTSELQSLRHLVCRLLLEKKNEHPAHRATARALKATG